MTGPVPIQINPFLKYETGFPDKHLVMSSDQFTQMINFMHLSPVVTFDFETSGTRWFQHAEACGIALAGWDPQRPAEIHNFYVPFAHKTPEFQLNLPAVHGGIKSLLEHPTKLKIAHNLKFDLHMARKAGWNPQGPFYDTMLAAHLYDENRKIALKYRSETDLKRMDASHFEGLVDVEIVKLAKLHKMKKKEYKAAYGYSQINIPLLGTYACFDAEFTTLLYAFYERIGISRNYPRIWMTEMSLIEAITDMEQFGMPVDVGYLEELKEKLAAEQLILYDKIRKSLGRDISLSADDEIRHLLKTWGCKLTELTKAGNKRRWKGEPIFDEHYSVERKVLEGFVDNYPILREIIDWRIAEKLRTTYTDSILTRLDKNNCIHPDYQQIGTETGRTSCQKPNFQNQPSDSNSRAVDHCGKGLEDGGVDPWSIRRAFINRGKKWVRLFYDYSQIELRVLAFYTQDPVMVDAYMKNEDIHSRTSMEVFGTKEKGKRRYAKVINFGLAYGLSPAGFARQTGVPLAEAQSFFDIFFERYKGLSDFRVKFWSELRSNNGYFKNRFGRPRRVPAIVSFDGKTRGSAERRSFGSLIQGTASELTKESCVRLWRRFKEEKLPAWLVATVHDEIQVDCHRDVVAMVGKIMKQEMENYPELHPIPVIVDGDYTLTSWADKNPIGD